MTDFSSTMGIFFHISTLFRLYFQSDFTSLNIPLEKKLTVPNVIKESVETYVVYAMVTYAADHRRHLYSDEEFDKVFHLLADLIEHVLENHENKKLLINYFTNNERLVRKIEGEFGQREHFKKIKIHKKDMFISKKQTHFKTTNEYTVKMKKSVI